jgi:hypothetical protein
MTKSINYETKDIHTKDGNLRFGHIHKDQVISSAMLQGQGGLEYITIDQTAPRKGWITSRCRGRYQINCGDNIEKGQPAFWLDAKTGDIVISTRGRIRMEAENIDLIAYGSDASNGYVNILGKEGVNIEGRTININGNEKMSIFTDGSMQMTAMNILKMYTGDMQSLTATSNIKPPTLPILPSIINKAFTLNL